MRRDFESNTDVPLIKGYGQAEAASASVLEVLVVGFPAPQVSASRIQHGKAVDADAGGVPIRDCPAGREASSRSKGRASFLDTETPFAERRAIDSSGSVFDGRFVTGDRGSVDGQGFVSLVGRAKDFIIRDGHNIDPRTVEAVAVAVAVAVGQPRAHSGEVLFVCVVLRGDAPQDTDSLLTWARASRLNRRQLRCSFMKIDELPLTAVGKGVQCSADS